MAAATEEQKRQWATDRALIGIRDYLADLHKLNAAAISPEAATAVEQIDAGYKGLSAALAAAAKTEGRG